MPFRVSFFYVQQSTKLAGWSTNFWALGSDRSATQRRATDLAIALQGCTGAQAYIQSYRISAYPSDRLPTNQETGFSPSTDITPGTDADYPTSSLQLIERALPSYRATIWLSGIPDAIITSSGRYIPTPTFTGRLNRLVSTLVDPANQWGVNVLNRATPKHPITALNTATGVLTVPAHGWGAAGTITRIRVTGFRVPLVVNKVWRITVITADTVQLNYWTGLSDPTANGNNPQAQEQLYTQIAMLSAAPGAGTKHDRGRPIGLLTGRRRKRRS